MVLLLVFVVCRRLCVRFLSSQRLGPNRLKRLRMDALPKVFRILRNWWKIVLLAVVNFLLLCHFAPMKGLMTVQSEPMDGVQYVLMDQATAQLQSLLTDPAFPHALPSATATSPIPAPDSDTHTAVHTPERHSATPSTIPPTCPTACGSSTHHATPPRAVHESPTTVHPVAPAVTARTRLVKCRGTVHVQAILMHAQTVQYFVTDQFRQWIRRVQKVVQARFRAA